MAQTGDLQVGEIGVKLSLDTGRDLSAFTSVEIAYRRPNGTAGSFVAVVEAPAAGGIISYVTTSAADLDLPGVWSFQAKLLGPGSEVIFGRAVLKAVKPLFEV